MEGIFEGLHFKAEPSKDGTNINGELLVESSSGRSELVRYYADASDEAVKPLLTTPRFTALRVVADVFMSKGGRLAVKVSKCDRVEASKRSAASA